MKFHTLSLKAAPKVPAEQEQQAAAEGEGESAKDTSEWQVCRRWSRAEGGAVNWQA